jgi:hypothetical protein
MRELAWSLALPVAFAALFILSSRESASFAQSLTKLDQPDLIGTWQLDLAKSRYNPGPGPSSETRIYARDADGVKGTIRRRYADGREEVIEYRADFDHEYPVSGTEAYDAIRFKRIDSHTAEAVLSHAGRVFGTARRVIAKDGQSMTITVRRVDNDILVNNLAVYQKER